MLLQVPVPVILPVPVLLPEPVLRQQVKNDRIVTGKKLSVFRGLFLAPCQNDSLSGGFGRLAVHP